jgi:hypothetical protein
MLLEILKHILTQPDGAQILLQILKRVVLNTPTWVYALFVSLVGFGWSQRRERTVNLYLLALAPLGMTAFSLYGTLQAFGILALGAWAAGVAAAIGVGLALKRPEGVRYSPEDASFRVPGSWTPLALMMAVFFVRYLIAVCIGIDPSLRQPGLFSLAASLAYGLLGGVFPARALRVWSQRFAN